MIQVILAALVVRLHQLVRQAHQVLANLIVLLVLMALIILQVPVYLALHVVRMAQLDPTVPRDLMDRFRLSVLRGQTRLFAQMDQLHLLGLMGLSLRFLLMVRLAQCCLLVLLVLGSLLARSLLSAHPALLAL